MGSDGGSAARRVAGPMQQPVRDALRGFMAAIAQTQAEGPGPRSGPLSGTRSAGRPRSATSRATRAISSTRCSPCWDNRPGVSLKSPIRLASRRAALAWREKLRSRPMA
jgi:hypothetical protein